MSMWVVIRVGSHQLLLNNFEWRQWMTSFLIMVVIIMNINYFEAALVIAPSCHLLKLKENFPECLWKAKENVGSSDLLVSLWLFWNYPWPSASKGRALMVSPWHAVTREYRTTDFTEARRAVWLSCSLPMCQILFYHSLQRRDGMHTQELHRAPFAEGEE